MLVEAFEGTNWLLEIERLVELKEVFGFEKALELKKLELLEVLEEAEKLEELLKLDVLNKLEDFVNVFRLLLFVVDELAVLFVAWLKQDVAVQLDNVGSGTLTK